MRIQDAILTFQSDPRDVEGLCALGSGLLVLARIEEGAGGAERARELRLRVVEVMGPNATISAHMKVLDIYVRALLLLGRVEEARPFAQHLIQTGWRNRELTDLCRRSGLLTS